MGKYDEEKNVNKTILNYKDNEKLLNKKRISDITLSDLKLSGYAERYLAKAGIKTVDELLSLPELKFFRMVDLRSNRYAFDEIDAVLNRLLEFGIERSILQDKIERLEQEKKDYQEYLKSIMDLPIEELELTTRSYYCLKKVSVNRIGDLTSMTEEEVLNIRNLGRKSFQTIIRSLEEFGLFLKES